MSDDNRNALPAESDLHCCLNCSFYDLGAYNDCREPQAERVLDKIRSNFCDFFKFKQTGKSSGTADSGTKDKLEDLFKKNDWQFYIILFNFCYYRIPAYETVLQCQQ